MAHSRRRSRVQTCTSSGIALVVTAQYDGPALLQHLETVDITRESRSRDFRLPVQWVCRPDQTFRGFAGPVLSGTLRRGDSVVVAGSGTIPIAHPAKFKALCKGITDEYRRDLDDGEWGELRRRLGEEVAILDEITAAASEDEKRAFVERVGSLASGAA